MTDRHREPSPNMKVLLMFTVPIVPMGTVTYRLAELGYAKYRLQSQAVDALGDLTWKDEEADTHAVNLLADEVVKQGRFAWTDKGRRVVAKRVRGGQLHIECRNSTNDGWVPDYSLKNPERFDLMCEVLNPRTQDKRVELPVKDGRKETEE